MLLWRAARSLKGIVQHRLSEPARQLHIPRRIGIQADPSFVSGARTIYDCFISRVKPTVSTRPLSRSLYSSHPSFHQSVSLASRNAPKLGAPCLPRPPRVPASVTHVGLGSARNFSTARPIFQHLVENVPVAGRAIYEIDWDLRMREQRQSLAHNQKEACKSRRAAKPAPNANAYVDPAVTDAEEIQHYFHTPTTSVTTYLQIPLAPTPTSRVPLSSFTSTPPQLLPISALAREHALHSKQAIRVSSLFRRLDAARVWDRGASCETYGDPSGLCTVLRIIFVGWTEGMVMQVLGVAGRDWCSIQEIGTESRESDVLEGSILSDVTPVFTPEVLQGSSGLSTDMGFIMPTIDMSTNFDWDASTSSWAALPPRSDSPPVSEAGSEYILPSSELEWDHMISTPPEWVGKWSCPNFGSASPSLDGTNYESDYSE